MDAFAEIQIPHRLREQGAVQDRVQPHQASCTIVLQETAMGQARRGNGAASEDQASCRRAGALCEKGNALPPQ